MSRSRTLASSHALKQRVSVASARPVVVRRRHMGMVGPSTGTKKGPDPRTLDLGRLCLSERRNVYRFMPPPGAGRGAPGPPTPPAPVVARGSLYGSKFGASLSCSLVNETFSLGAELVTELGSPGM